VKVNSYGFKQCAKCEDSFVVSDDVVEYISDERKSLSARKSKKVDSRSARTR
jgi:hypothetical protein